MSSSDVLYRERLHPAAVLISGLAQVRENMILVLVLVALSSAGGGFEPSDLLRALVWAPLLGVLAVAGGAFTWATTRFSLGHDAMTLETGLLGRSETTVPLERVQALDEVAGPLHRLFRVVRLDVQTAGGNAGGEISLAAVGAGTLAAIRDAVRGRRGDEAVEAPEAGPSRRLGRGALLAAALTSGSLGVLLPVVAFVPSVLNELFSAEEGQQEAAALLDLAPDTAAEWLTAGAVVLGVAWLLSALGVIVAFAGFRAERLPDRVVITRGLLQRRRATVPVARVQAVRVVEGVLRQPFGLAAVRVEVAGYAAEASAAQTLFPLLRARDVPALVRELLPEMPHEIGPLTPAPRRALRRYVLPRVLFATLLACATGIVMRSPLPFLVLLPAAAHGVLAYRATGFRVVQDGRLALRSRLLARTTLLGPLRLTQEHSVRQSVLQRRAGLADFAIAFGSAGDARVRHVEAADAWTLFAAATRRALTRSVS